MTGTVRLRHVAAIVAVGALPAASQPATAASPSGEQGAAAAARQSTISRVTARLANKRFTRFTQSGMSSFDQRLHLCRDKRFIYDTVSSIEGGIVPPDVRRVEGTWRVISGRISGKVWTARVRGTPSDGSPPLTVRFRTDGKRVTVDGNLASAERSDLC
ncbi:MAG: hypothetical protein QOJ12_1909 [Thermoleophilales bacterium]|nr:hypothetical protein [Thermoleophilales bacterium]